MRYTKIAMAGLAAVLTLNGAAAVFAEETGSESTRPMFQMEKPEDFDMSGLELPEDFVPFDENHVPDGKNAPANGELRPIEFDEEGNMLFGQKPDGMPPMMNGERPELPEGEMPAFGEGERPELPEGEMPAFGEGERPELPEGEMPASGEGELPELPENGQMSQMNGQMGQMPQMGGQMGQMPQMGGQRMPMNSQNGQSGQSV